MASVAHAVGRHGTKVASPELTALDLLQYTQVSGTLDSVALLLAGLGGELRAGSLAELAQSFRRPVLQRLGYLLDYVGHSDIAAEFHWNLSTVKSWPWAELEPVLKREGSSEIIERNAHWKVIVRRFPELG